MVEADLKDKEERIGAGVGTWERQVNVITGLFFTKANVGSVEI